MDQRHIIPWIEVSHYEAFRGAAIDQLSLPDTYGEWLRVKANEKMHFEAAGVVVQKVLVHPDEFAAYCLANGLERSAAMFREFAAKKAWERNKN